jgi:AcrR family transcriptional regulator
MNSRRYSMATRARSAEATRQRILDAARDLFEAKSSGFTLENVATAAGVSVQTVLRAFGSKDELIMAVIGSVRDRSRPFGRAASPEQAVTRLFDDYEEIGDRVVRMLAVEDQVAGFADLARLGRANHREWVQKSFEARLDRCAAGEREAVVTALVLAMDVYVWKVRAAGDGPAGRSGRGEGERVQPCPF